MRKIILSIFCAGLSVTAAYPQEAPEINPAIEYGRQFRADGAVLRQESVRQAGAETPDEVPWTPGDLDLGEQMLLKRDVKLQPFTFGAETAGYYTNNVALARRNTLDDVFLTNQMWLSYQPRLAPDLLGEVTVRQAMFRYDKFSVLDFESFNAGAGLTYTLRPLWNIAFNARYNYQHLTSDWTDIFYQNHTVTFGLAKTFPIARAHYFFTGISSQVGWSDPVRPERNEHSIYGGYHVNFSRSLAGSAFYKLAWHDYSFAGRDDIQQNFALALRLSVTRWLSVSSSVFLGVNRSDNSIHDYDVFNGGGGITANINF